MNKKIYAMEERQKALLVFLDIFGFRAKYGDLCAPLNEEVLIDCAFTNDVFNILSRLPYIQFKILLDRFDKPRGELAKELGISRKKMEELECAAWMQLRAPEYSKQLTIYAEKYRKLEEVNEV